MKRKGFGIMNDKRKNGDVNPYDLNQVSKIKTNRSRVVRTRSLPDDPYSTSSSAYGVKDSSRASKKNK